MAIGCRRKRCDERAARRLNDLLALRGQILITGDASAFATFGDERDRDCPRADTGWPAVNRTSGRSARSRCLVVESRPGQEERRPPQDLPPGTTSAVLDVVRRKPTELRRTSAVTSSTRSRTLRRKRSTCSSMPDYLPPQPRTRSRASIEDRDHARESHRKINVVVCHRVPFGCCRRANPHPGGGSRTDRGPRKRRGKITPGHLRLG